jgi:hypothetical protein
MSELHMENVLSVSEGEKRLSEVIESFSKAVEAYEPSSNNEAPQLAIKATAGLGKTSQIIKNLISKSALRSGHVHYYVPNHRLSGELQESLSMELGFNMTQLQDKGPRYNRSIIIAGRNQKDRHGNTLCQKSNVTEQAAKAGINIEKKFCKNENNTCEYYDNCVYQNQFELYDIGIPKDWPKELDHYVTVMTHANLFLQTNKRLPKPALIVVDESFYQSSKNVIKVNSVELYADENPISGVIVKHLRAGEVNLLAKLRELGYSYGDLEDEANIIDSKYANDNQTSFSPSLSLNRQQSLVKETLIKRRASLVLKVVAEEMMVSNRSECHRLGYHHRDELVLIYERKELTIPEDVPTVFIDADAQEEILRKLRKNVLFEKIEVERQAVFHQVSDLTFSRNLLINNDEKKERIQQEVKRFISHIAKDGLTLVVCSKVIRAELTGEDKMLMKQESQLEGATVIHFGNLRGLNEYSDYRNVIILGREQPSAEGIENNARSLFWDDKESIKFLSFKGKYKPLENEDRFIHLKDGSSYKVPVQIHPDKRVQLLLEQSRERESLQSIDRLRLLRPHKDGQRNVYILSSVPLGLTIDNLFSWKRLQKLVDLLGEANGVIPLNPKHLMKRCPVVATSERTAKRLISDLKEANPLINIYIREMALFSIDYRITNKGKYSEALVSKDINKETIINNLSLLLDTGEVELK